MKQQQIKHLFHTTVQHKIEVLKSLFTLIATLRLITKNHASSMYLSISIIAKYLDTLTSLSKQLTQKISPFVLEK